MRVIQHGMSSGDLRFLVIKRPMISLHVWRLLCCSNNVKTLAKHDMPLPLLWICKRLTLSSKATVKYSLRSSTNENILHNNYECPFEVIFAQRTCYEHCSNAAQHSSCIDLPSLTRNGTRLALLHGLWCLLPLSSSKQIYAFELVKYDLMNNMNQTSFLSLFVFRNSQPRSESRFRDMTML